MTLMTIFERLSVARRLTLLGALGVLLLAVPLTMYLKATQSAIGLAQEERAGVEPARRLAQLMNLTQQHRQAALASLLPDGAGAGAASLGELQSRIAKATASMTERIPREGGDEIVTAWERVVEDWKAVAARVNAREFDARGSHAAHSAIMESYLSLGELLADQSGLTLDPEAEGYHLMMATVIQMPQLAEVLGQLRGQGTGMLAQKAISEADRLALSGLLNQARVLKQAIDRELDKAVKVNAGHRDLVHATRVFTALMDSASARTRDDLVEDRRNGLTSSEYAGVYGRAIDGLYKLNGEALNSLEGVLDARTASLRATQGLVLVAIAAMAFLCLVLGVVITRSILRQLGGEPAQAAVIALSVADGQLDVPVDVREGDRTSLMATMRRMQEQLRERAERDRKAAADLARVKLALDSSSSGAMIADEAGVIIYLNKAQQKMLEEAEADLRTLVPDFRAAGIIGRNVDLFHRATGDTAALTGLMHGPVKSTLRVGRRNFRMLAVPVFDAGGVRQGTALRWADRTVEIAMEQEIAAVIAAAAEGNFAMRLALEGKSGFFRQLAESVNQLMETSQRGLDSLGQALERLAGGDLSARIEGDYLGAFARLRDSANATAANLAAIARQIKDTSAAIDSASGDVSRGSRDLARRTEDQASSLQETASAMEELTATVKQNAENARQGCQLAEGASSVAVRGGEVVRQVVSTMNGIAESSRRIAEITGLIDAIAFQTNLLALNAAVEAARAGEHGRGFAVVASEVRGLAQRSASAAREIKALIVESAGKVDAGSQQVVDAGATMEEIVLSVRRVADIMNDITAASQEQSAGIEQVNRAVAQMDEVTQQNTGLVEEAASAAESMREQAGTLVQAVAAFRLPAEATATRAGRGSANAGRMDAGREGLRVAAERHDKPAETAEAALPSPAAQAFARGGRSNVMRMPVGGRGMGPAVRGGGSGSRSAAPATDRRTVERRLAAPVEEWTEF